MSAETSNNGGLDRRAFLKAALALPSAALAAPLAAPLAARARVKGRRSRKPNLLFLWADQHRPDTMKVYGNNVVQAPSFNRLADESVVFENAYSTQPVCTPARSTVLTGLWPHTNGCVNNGIPLQKTTPAFPELLRDADYRTGYFGKWHLGDELFPQHGFEEWVSIEDIYDRSFGSDRDQKERSDYDEFLRDRGFKPDLPSDKFSREFASRLPLEHGKPRFLEQKTIEFLKRHQAEPFVLYVNFLEPHPPYDGPFNDRYDPAALRMPPNFMVPPGEDEPLAYRVKSARDRTLRPQQGIDLSTDAGWRRMIANYYGNVTHVDGAVGGILDALEELGLADDTIVVHTADHGEMLGAHAMGQKEVMYEEAMKVPWLMRVPRLGRKQKVIKGRFSHIDLVPTLLDLMDKPIPDALQGRSLVRSIEKGSHRDPAFVEWSPGEPGRKEIPLPGFTADEVRRAKQSNRRAVISPDGWKLVLADADKNQLYDLKRDPYELENLFYTKRHDDVVRRLTREIRDWQKETGDGVTVGPEA